MTNHDHACDATPDTPDRGISAGPSSTGDQPPHALVDGALVRARRLELNLSERKFSEMLGANFSQSVLRGLEAGTNHPDLTLGELVRVAKLLDLPLGRALGPAAHQTTDEPPDPLGPGTHAEHIDAAVASVAAVLIEAEVAFPVQALAALRGYTLEETDEALRELDRRLAPAGLRVRRVHDKASIRATEPGLPGSKRSDVVRKRLTRRSLDTGEARVLARAAAGELHKVSNEDVRVRGSSLVNAGILRRTSAGGFELTDDAAYSLHREPGSNS